MEDLIKADGATAPLNCNGVPITDPVVLNILANPRILSRRSGSATAGFLDCERKPVEPEVRPVYPGPPSGRTGNAAEKRGAWQLEDE